MKKIKHEFSAEESKKIIDLLCEKYQLSQAIVNKTYTRTGFLPVEEPAQQIASNFDIGTIIDVEYFAGEDEHPMYNSVTVDDEYGCEYLSAEASTLAEAYQYLADMICNGVTLNRCSSSLMLSGMLICKLPPFSSYEELALKLAIKGEE